MLIAGVFGFATYFVKSSLEILVVTCLFSLTIATANFVIGSVVVDIFPTHVGAIAICMMTCFGRIGAIASNLAFGMLLDISCEVPIFLVGSIVIGKQHRLSSIQIWITLCMNIIIRDVSMNCSFFYIYVSFFLVFSRRHPRIVATQKE